MVSKQIHGNILITHGNIHYMKLKKKGKKFKLALKIDMYKAYDRVE